MSIVKRLLIVVAGVLVVVLGYTILSTKNSSPLTESQIPGGPPPLVVSNQPPLDVNPEDIWHPRPLTTTDVSNRQIHSAGLGFQLTGTIIEPDFSAAFIFDMAAHKEDLYYQGDSIREWVIQKISRDQVVLRNADNRSVILSLHRKQSSSGLQSSPEVKTPPTPTEHEFYTPSTVDKLIKTTSLETALSMARRLPEGTVRSILDKLPQDYLRKKLALADLGLAPEDLAGTNPAELIISLAKVGLGEIPAGGLPLEFSTHVHPSNNNPVLARNSFNTQDKKIYACFKNEGALAGLNKIVVYWKNVSTNEIVYWGSQPIDVAKSYNYIWVKEKSNWDSGTYLVALFKTAKDTTCLAQGRYEIK